MSSNSTSPTIPDQSDQANAGTEEDKMAGPQAGGGPNIQVAVLHECQTVMFTWSSTSGPFKAWIWTGTGGVGTILSDFGNLDKPQVGWAVDLARGQEVQLAVRDAAGQTFVSAPSTILPGDCPPGFPLRTIGGDNKPAAPSEKASSAAPQQSVSQAPPLPNQPSVKAESVPTPSFSPLPSKSPASDAPIFSQFSAPASTPPSVQASTAEAGGSARPVDPATPASFGAGAALSSSVTPVNGQSTASSLPPQPAVSAPSISASSLRSTHSSALPSASSPAIAGAGSISPDSSSKSEHPSRFPFPFPDPPFFPLSIADNSASPTMIAGIVGGVACAVLFFALLTYVFCRHRRQTAEFAGRSSDDDYVHFVDSASISSRSFAPIYARFRSETNLAGRGAGGPDGGGYGGAEEKEVEAGLGDRDRDDTESLQHLAYTAPTSEATRDDLEDMTAQPILDPAILGRSAPVLPKPKRETRSTWRSSFGALVSWLGPSSPLPVPGASPSAFRLGKRATRGPYPYTEYIGEGSETLTSGVGLSRTNTLRTDRSGGGGGDSGPEGLSTNAKAPSYRASSSTFANPFHVPTPTTPTAAALAVLSSGPGGSRSLFPRRQSGGTVKTSRSRRSIATFGAGAGSVAGAGAGAGVNLHLAPQALISPTMPLAGAGGGGAGLLSPALPSPATALSPGSEDSFGDIMDHSELAYAQPTPVFYPGSTSGPSAYVSHQPQVSAGHGIYREAEGIVSRVSIAKYERPRTLMFTRSSYAGSAFGSTGSVDRVQGERGGMGSEGEGEVEGEKKEQSRLSGKWSDWRRSIRRSLGGGTDDEGGVGHAI